MEWNARAILKLNVPSIMGVSVCLKIPLPLFQLLVSQNVPHENGNFVYNFVHLGGHA